MTFSIKKYCIAILCFLAWGSILFAQDRILHNERLPIINSELNSHNPALLQVFEDSIFLNVNTCYNFGKGDYVNYYSPDSYSDINIKTESYNRLSPWIVVYGFASYGFLKEKNCLGTSFLDPYRVPFNFVEYDEDARGDRNAEHYNLAGAISYHLFNKWNFGAKADYKTISFVKLKDMRHISDILDFKLNAGISYQWLKGTTLGLSYKYYRYIENIEFRKYGLDNISNYALLDRGTFMGQIHLYGESGILDTYDEKPWVDIAHGFGLQNTTLFSDHTKWFVEIAYQHGKGHFGNENNSEVVYMRHNNSNYTFNSQLTVLQKKTTHIITVNGQYSKLINKEQLYQQSRTDGGVQIVTYYGEKETLNRKNYNASVEYQLLWGDTPLKAPWKLFAGYSFHNISRNSTYYPYYRKQNIKWHTILCSIEKTVTEKKIGFTFKYASSLSAGSGGDPIDGSYFSSTTTPSFCDEFLYKEKDYLTNTQLLSSLSIRAGYGWKENIDLFMKIYGSFQHPFNAEYLDGNFTRLSFSAGLAF